MPEIPKAVLNALKDPVVERDGQVKAFCPCHKDGRKQGRRSLSVTMKNGKLLVHCFAGCRFEDVFEALGLVPPAKTSSGRRDEEAVFDYQNAAGELVCQVVRYRRSDGTKDFRVRRSNGNGAWIWNARGIEDPVYRLPEILAAIAADETVFVGEGEKVVDRLASLGLPGTTNRGGAGKWKDHHAGYLKGARVVILPDNDEPGRKHGRSVATSLRGICAEVRVLELPDLPEKGDAVDWLDAGHTKAELLELAERTPLADPSTEDSEPEAKQTPLAVEADDMQHDYGHASTLSTLFLDRFRWADHRGSWMEYTGKAWKPVPEARIAKIASDDLRIAYSRELGSVRDKTSIKRLSKAVHETTIYARIKGALAFLRGWDEVLTYSEEWDAAPWLLNVGNGTVDLRALSLRPHSPKDLFTQLAPVDFDADARAPHWEKHLERFLPNESIRRQVRRDLGLSLVGATLEEALPIWYGHGRNGKSTTARVIMTTLGNYAIRAAPSLLIEKKHDSHPTELADLAGRRLAFSVEVDDGRKMAEALVKDLTGGDRKKARYMRGDFFEFDQTFSLVLVVNYKPVIRGVDEGIWRRIRLIPWEEKISESEQRPQEEVVDELLSEGSGILSWMLKGLVDWHKDNRWTAPEVQAATDQYRAEQDALGGFLAESCDLGPRYVVAVKALYEKYAAWCDQGGEEPRGKSTFNKMLKNRGMGRDREPGTGAFRWVGLRLKNREV